MQIIRLALSMCITLFAINMAQSEPITIKTRSQILSATSGGKYRSIENEATWESSKTAVIIVDMWDDHWCPKAAKRVAEMSKPMNKVIKLARDKGMFIIHAPSSTVDFYKGTAARKRAINAPSAKPPKPLSKDVRWGTNWCWPDKFRETELPIDDSDMGCDCEEEFPIREAWSRQIETIEIDEQLDAITDNGLEAYNLLVKHKIENVILMGVHLNMCVLGRPVGIRQMVNIGKNVVLMRDMTDTMYNPKKRPFVNHFEGTDLVVKHVEKFWCPSITSTSITGKDPFVFKNNSQ
jgi:nicotinamidase-related amidase